MTATDANGVLSAVYDPTIRALRISQGPGGGDATLLTPTALNTSATNAAALDYVRCDTTAGSFAVTLPTAPLNKTVVAVQIVDWVATTAVTVNAGGTARFYKAGGPTTTTLEMLGQATVFQYYSASNLWFPQDHLLLASLDTRYALASTLAAALTGVARKAQGYIGDGVNVTYQFSHNLNDPHPLIQFTSDVTGEVEDVPWVRVDDNTSSVTFGYIPALNTIYWKAVA